MRGQPAPGSGVDDVGKRLIEQLQQDGRRSYAAIGKVVGLSEAAVRQRVQRLLDTGVMQIVAVTDPMELGFARQAMIGLTVEGPLEPVADALAEMEEIEYVVITAGSFGARPAGAGDAAAVHRASAGAGSLAVARLGRRSGRVRAEPGQEGVLRGHSDVHSTMITGGTPRHKRKSGPEP